jgi:CRISPR/Cas system-associated exonuclease Cas4 (RecB family)
MIMTHTSHLPDSFTFSQSSLQDYSDCERRFYLRYIEQLAWPAVESEPALENEQHQVEGQTFHRLVQQSLLGLPGEKLTGLANTPTLSQWWENYQIYEFNLSEYEIFPELNLISQIGKHRLTAKYDLVAVGDHKFFIYDWKTYHKRPSQERMAVTYQTRVYRSLLVRAGGCLIKNKPVNPDEIVMVYWLANFPTQPIQLPYNSSQSLRDWKHLENLTNRIEQQEIFPMTADEKKCKYCQFRSYCDRGISAASYEDDHESLVEMSDLTMDQIPEIES